MYRTRHRERRETLAYWPVEDTEKSEAVGLVTDLSAEGIQIHSNHKFRKGKALTVRIAVDAALIGTDHISLVIQNVWCRASGIHGLYHTGFKIVEISETERRNLQKLFQAFSYPAPASERNAEGTALSAIKR